MNWKDYPHLFANGKFEVKTGFSNSTYKSDKFFIFVLGRAIDEKYQLIARPISDMSDEEVISHQGDLFSDGDFIDDHRGAIKNRATKGFLSFKEALNFISIGVYPFDDDTDVIWRYEND